MGNCCQTVDEKDNDVDDLVLESHDYLNKEFVKVTAFYQKIIDHAQRKFLTASNHHRSIGFSSDSQLLRNRLLEASFDLNSLEIYKASLDVHATAANIQPSRVIETLSKPIDLKMYDAVADEMAALVSRHTATLDIEDINRIVATFKPVIAN